MNLRADKRAIFEQQLAEAARHISRRDAALRPIIKRHNPCLIRPHTRYFETLVDAIISQQLSTKVAEVIVGRFKAIYGVKRFPKPEQILATPSETIRAVGMSNSKVAFIKDLAAKTEDGTLRLNRLSRMTDQEIIDMLTQVKGIGVWTVHMFLIFSLGRLDVLPVGDLGIRRAIQQLYGFDHDPKPEEMELLAQERGWRPYCSVASWFLWRSWENK